jgi:regulator of sigma E protease
VLWNAIVPGVVLLGVVIFVHELGHFAMAKWRGVKVLRFSLGFGPALLAARVGETEYRLSWIPLGGYVHMAGDSPGEDGTMPGSEEEFLSHPWFGRALIAIAGPAANLIAAYLALVAVGVLGVSYPDFPNVLGATPDTSVAWRAGLREGDHLVAVNGKPVGTWIQIFVTTSAQPASSPVEITVERAGRTLTVRALPEEREPLMSSLRRPPDPPVVGAVVTGMPAYKAGLKEGDRITAVNGRPIQTWDQLPPALQGEADHEVKLTVERQGRTLTLGVTPINADGGRAGSGRIGIEAPRHGVYVERHSLLESMGMGFRATGSLLASVYSGMWLTVSRPLYYREYLGGPMFIAQAASEQARRGLDSYLQFMAMINIAVMSFNLLPIPALDGGHILLALVQAVRGRAISARGYQRFQRVGLVVIVTLFVFILANDPLRWVQRQRALDRARPPAPPESTIAPAAP